MLTQKMSKEALLIARGIDVDFNREMLLDSVELFDKILSGLYHGNRELNLTKTTDLTILRALDRVSKEWRPFKGDILKVADGDGDRETLEAIDRRSVELLRLVNMVVELYRDRGDIEPQLAQTINMAGKERMLSQKMAKELLLIANNLKSDRNRNSLMSSGELFKRTLHNLIKNKRQFRG